jgi:cytoskeletal protein CcmA (bactofilin family)
MSSKQPPAPLAPPAAPPPARRFTDSRERPGTVIGASIKIKGELTGGDSVDLAGSLEGTSRVEGFYLVREGARVVGPIAAADVVVEGEVEGTLIEGRKVEIGAASRVRAHIRASVVAIAEGAFFEGQIDMSGEEGETARLAFRERRRREGQGRGLPPAAPPPAAPPGEKK